MDAGRWKRKRLALLTVVMAVYLLTFFAPGPGETETSEPTAPEVIPQRIAGSVETTTQETTALLPEKQGSTNFLLIGHNHNLADTMILCCVDRDRRIITMVSFLRDLYLPIPAYAGHPLDWNRMNSCYFWGKKWTEDPEGGMELLSLCLEENFGICVDHCVSVDFEAFVHAVDHLGGVNMELTEAEAEYLSRKVGYVGQMQPGLQRLSGTEALAYCRIRKIDSDVQRTDRQRKLMSALLAQATSCGVGELLSVAGEVIPYVETDLSPWDISRYLSELLSQWKDYQIQSLCCPADNDSLPDSYVFKTVRIGGTDCSVIVCDIERNRRYLMQRLNGEETD